MFTAQLHKVYIALYAGKVTRMIVLSSIVFAFMVLIFKSNLVGAGAEHSCHVATEFLSFYSQV